MLSHREAAIREYLALTEEAKRRGQKQLKDVMRMLCLTELYFLLVFVLKQKHMNEGPEYKKDWIFDRCREVQAQPDDHLDLWAREHMKTTIITYGKTIQDNLNDPELTFGFFSFVRPIAKGFLNQIKREYEANQELIKLFPEVLWADPQRDAPKWSENDGLILRRKGNPKEATLEAWGLVDGQPTSKHFDVIVYDDIITEDSVTNPDKIKKVTKAWELSLNLSKEGGKFRYAGTIYHFADTYETIKQRQVAVPRVYPGTKDGTAQGEPVLFTPEYMAKKRTGMSAYVFACQILLNPKAESVVGFDEKDIRWWDASHYNNLNIYLLVDPASSKKKDSDYTVMDVIGLGADENFYWIDGCRDRLNLEERTRRLIRLHKDYRPQVVAYEQYGMQSDIEHVMHVQDQINYHFDITPLGGKVAKADRIEWLVPVFKAHRFYFPHRIIQQNHMGIQEDVVQTFINEEYRIWPYALHDDGLDNKSRILDPDLQADFPMMDNRYRQTVADTEYNMWEAF